jgi:hypothetical protein
MSVSIRSPETDLILPLPLAGEQWDPHTIHTHYFGFSVPEAEIGAFIYIRYQPAFGLSQGGVCIFRGLDNIQPQDMEFCDYEITMPWPKIDGRSITTANGLRVEFVEPGVRANVHYESQDGAVAFALEQVAVTPLLARGNIFPGEDERSDPAAQPGGSEQMMHCTGELELRGERFAIDCYAPRDRSWRQVRVEARNSVALPPHGWTPMHFGSDLVFNQVGIESIDTDPAWAKIYDFPATKPASFFGWVVRDGEVREVTRVRRRVLEYHPNLYAALRQELEAEDESGQVYRFNGEAIAMATIPAWPNTTFRDSVYRWESEDGRVTHATYQEIWWEDYQRTMHARARNGAHSSAGA